MYNNVFCIKQQKFPYIILQMENRTVRSVIDILKVNVHLLISNQFLIKENKLFSSGFFFLLLFLFVTVQNNFKCT